MIKVIDGKHFFVVNPVRHSSAIPYSEYISFRKMFVLSRTRDIRSFYFRSCVDITN